MQNGYAQAEGVANLDGVPETGCLVAIGYPKFRGGTGGYTRYVAVIQPSQNQVLNGIRRHPTLMASYPKGN